MGTYRNLFLGAAAAVGFALSSLEASAQITITVEDASQGGDTGCTGLGGPWQIRGQDYEGTSADVAQALSSGGTFEVLGYADIDFPEPRGHFAVQVRTTGSQVMRLDAFGADATGNPESIFLMGYQNSRFVVDAGGSKITKISLNAVNNGFGFFNIAPVILSQVCASPAGPTEVNVDAASADGGYGVTLGKGEVVVLTIDGDEVDVEKIDLGTVTVNGARPVEGSGKSLEDGKLRLAFRADQLALAEGWTSLTLLASTVDGDEITGSADIYAQAAAADSSCAALEAKIDALRALIEALSRSDCNRGHGNDDDGHDGDNPGNGNRNCDRDGGNSGNSNGNGNGGRSSANSGNGGRGRN